MSRASAETSLALFDRMQGRGDVFSVSIEDGAGLAALDEKTFASILLPVFRWWATGAEDKPSNTLALMMYERLKTHQLENAVRRGANLKNWLENAHKGGRPKDPEKTKRKPIGNQLETKRKPSGHSMEYEDSSCKLKTQVTSLQSCKLESSEGDNISRNGLTPSAHVAPSDEVPSKEKVENARKLIEEMTPKRYEDIPQLLIDNGPNKGKIAGWTRIAITGRTFDATAVWIASKKFPNDISTDSFEDIGGEDFSLDNYENDGSRGFRLALKLSELCEGAIGNTDGNARHNRKFHFKLAALKLFYQTADTSLYIDNLENLANAYRILDEAQPSKEQLSDADY